MIVSFALIIFHPEDVVGPIEGYKHNASCFGLAGELMLGLAWHHRRTLLGRATRGAIPSISVRTFPCDDDELFRRCVVMPGDQAIRRRFQDDGRRAFGGISSLNRRKQALDVVIRVEFDFGQRSERRRGFSV